MNESAHLLGIGKIVGNLHALEFVIRIFLGDVAGQKLDLPTPTTKEMPETFITNYMSLNELVEKYNSSLSPEEIIHSVDTEVVKIRDAIAHGRMVTLETYPLTLYKFGRIKNGIAPIEYAETLTEEWLAQKRDLVSSEMKKVLACGKARGYKTFPEIDFAVFSFARVHPPTLWRMLHWGCRVTSNGGGQWLYPISLLQRF